MGKLPSGPREFNHPSSPHKDAVKVKQCAQCSHSASGQMLAALPANQIVTPGPFSVAILEPQNVSK